MGSEASISESAVRCTRAVFVIAGVDSRPPFSKSLHQYARVRHETPAWRRNWFFAAPPVCLRFRYGAQIARTCFVAGNVASGVGNAMKYHQ